MHSSGRHTNQNVPWFTTNKKRIVSDGFKKALHTHDPLILGGQNRSEETSRVCSMLQDTALHEQTRALLLFTVIKSNVKRNRRFLYRHNSLKRLVLSKGEKKVMVKIHTLKPTLMHCGPSLTFICEQASLHLTLKCSNTTRPVCQLDL